MIRFKNLDAIKRAIAWAEANPDQIISGHLAKDNFGDSVTTGSPYATCFCLVGRIAKETGADVKSTYAGLRTFVMNGDEAKASVLWMINDEGLRLGDPLRGFNKLKELIL